MADKLVLRAPGSGTEVPRRQEDRSLELRKGMAGPGLGRILKQPSAPRDGRQRRPGEERWKPGGRPAVRPAGPGFAEMLRGLGSHSEELSAAPCGRSAPLRSPHVLS